MQKSSPDVLWKNCQGKSNAFKSSVLTYIVSPAIWLLNRIYCSLCLIVLETTQDEGLDWQHSRGLCSNVWCKTRGFSDVTTDLSDLKTHNKTSKSKKKNLVKCGSMVFFLDMKKFENRCTETPTVGSHSFYLWFQ